MLPVDLSRAADWLLQLVAAIACLAFVSGLSDVVLESPPEPPASRLLRVGTPQDADLQVLIRHTCKTKKECPAVSGAQVRVLWEHERRYYVAAEGTARSDGVLDLLGLPRGPVWIISDAPGRARGSQRIWLHAGQQRTELSLGSARQLTVTVSTETGSPLPQATVLVQSADPLPHGSLTDSDGRAAFRRLDESPWVVKVSAPGYESTTRQQVSHDLPVTLRRLGGLQISVTTTSGEPAAGATVLIVGSRLWPARRATTEADGRTRIRGLLAGTYDVVARTNTQTSDTIFGLVLQQSEDREIQLTLRPGRSVTALVTAGSSEDSAAVEGAEVVLAEAGLSPFPLRGRTGAEGTVVLGPIGSGPATLSARADGFVASAAVPVPEDLDGPVRVALVRGGTVEGEVVDLNGHPIDGASIEIVGTDLQGMPIAESPTSLDFRRLHFSWAMAAVPRLVPAGELGVMPGPVPPIPRLGQIGPVGSEPTTSTAPWVTGVDGEFRAHPVSPGRVRALVQHPEYVPGTSQPFLLAPGGHAHVRVVLDVGGVLEGRVVDSRGFPVAGARIDVTAAEGTLEQTTMSDQNGDFTFAALPPVVKVSLARPEDLTRLVSHETVGVARGETTRVELRLPEPRESVRVTVLDEDAGPVEAAQVTILSVDPAIPLRQTLFTDAQGQAEFDDARGLDLQVIADAPRWTRSALQIANAPEELSVRLARGVVVTGTVTSVRGRRFVEGARVTLISGGRRRVASTNSEGAYRFDNVPVGPVRLVADHPDFAPHSYQFVAAFTGRPDRAFEVEPINLEEPGAVAGQVVDAHGAPVAGARVALGIVPAYLPLGALPEDMTVTDEHGNFRLGRVAPGVHSLEAYSPDVGRGAIGGVEVRSDRDTDGLLIRLDAENPGSDPPQSGNVAITLGERGEDPPVVVIVNVAAGSEAERAGLEAGDILSLIDGVRPRSMLDARARLAGREGSDVVLEVVRGEVRSNLRMTRERVRR